MKNFLLSTLFCIFSTFSFGVNILMPTTGTSSVTANCLGDVFYDNQKSGNYAAGANAIYTITPATAGTRLILTFNNWSMYDDKDYLIFYDGPSTSSPLLGTVKYSATSPGTIQASDMNITGSITVKFVSDAMSWGADGWKATITCRTPCAFPTASGTVNGQLVPNPALKVCQGADVTFNGTGSTAAAGKTVSSWAWTFDDGSAAGSGNTVTHKYTTPGIYKTILNVKDNTGCSNINSMINYIFVSTTPIFKGSNITPTSPCNGDPVALNGVITPVTATKPIVFPPTGTVTMPDGTGVDYDSPVTISAFTPGQTLTNINDLLSICITIEHSAIPDLSIVLKSPSGQTVTLLARSSTHDNTKVGQLGIPVTTDGVDYVCNSSASPGKPFCSKYPSGNEGVPGTGWVYCITPTATNGTLYSNATTGTQLPAGNYASENPLSALIGSTLNGTWTLSVTDNEGGDDGTLFAWSMSFASSLYPSNLTFTPSLTGAWTGSGIATTAANPATNVIPTATGAVPYKLTATDDFGCIYDTTISVTVQTCGCVSPPAVTFPVTSGSTCANAAITVANNTFSNTTGVTVAASGGTGTITAGASSTTSPFSFTYTPSAADAGKTITITATTAAVAPCVAATATYTLTVNPNNPVSVSIAANPGNSICNGVSVTFTATPVNGGATPAYQWYKNNIQQAGQTNATYTSATLANNDAIKCVLTSNGTCLTGNPATSNIITMTTSAVPVSVTIAAVPNTPICAGTSVVFTATPTNGGTTPAYRWFKNSTVITGEIGVTYTTTTLANSDIITCELTSNASCVTGNPATSNAITAQVNPNLPVSIGIVAVPGNSICNGASVTFNATPTNGGSTPAYQWYKNNTLLTGETNASYTSASLANNDAIKCVLTSNATCITGNPATSNVITMTTSVVPVSIAIAAVPNTPICDGTSVTFTATPTNGGTVPAYRWFKNSTVITGETNVTYTTTTLANGDVITCELTSNASCVTGSPATSASITAQVNPNLPVSVIIAANPGNSICNGTSVTFTATPTNGGTTPQYQWYKNNTLISGETNVTYTSSTLVNTDAIKCILTSNATCPTGNPATSNVITMTTAAAPVSVTIASVPNTTICVGTSVTYTATPINGGTTPTYRWFKNSTVIAGETNVTFTTTTLANADVITCELTSNMACATGSPATSNALVASVDQLSVAGTLSSDNTICANTAAGMLSLAGNNGVIVKWEQSSDNGSNWSTFAAAASNASHNLGSLATAGTFLYHVIVKNGVCPQITSNNSTIIVNPIPAKPTVTPQGPYCINDVANPLTATPSGSATLNWYTTQIGGLASTTAPTPSTLLASSTDYWVSQLENGCEGAREKITISVGSVVANAGLARTICAGTSAQLLSTGSVGAGITYSWTPTTDLSDATDLTPIASPSATTTYTLKVKQGACEATSDVVVNVISSPNTNFTLDDDRGCAPLTVNFSDATTFADPLIVTADNYLWEFSDGGTATSASPTYIFNTPGTFDVSLTATTGTCSRKITKKAIIFVYAIPKIDFGWNPVVPDVDNSTVNFSALSNITLSSFLWDFGDVTSTNNGAITEQPSHKFMEQGVYQVTLKGTANGCEDQVTHEITVKENPAIYIPSAFSPDRDGINESFGPIMYNYDLTSYSFVIYNRWGELVFSSSALDKRWDGTSLKSKTICPEGVYTWKLVFIDVLGKIYEYKGIVTLVE